MAIQNPRAPESAQFDETMRPATTTGARRHRPSTKGTAESETARRKRVKLERVEAASGRKERVSAQEDRREAPAEMVTDAKPRNLNAKGKATHALEATPPGKRPSRKSTRGGANHIKADSQQARANTRARRSPKTRHSARAA